MIGLMLRVLDDVELASFEHLSVEHIRTLAAAMAAADEARVEGLDALTSARFDHWEKRFHALRAQPTLAAPPSPAGPSSTTHVSVIDARGNAAAITFSFGEGNAHIIGDTGVMMNNLMGEEDLFPGGFGSGPRGARLPTMMSPTLMLDDDGGVTVLGTGGANRIRTAIVQVISLLTDFGMDCEHAVAAPRVHYEAGVLNAEVFEMYDSGKALEGLGARKLVAFPERSLFFGGVHMVQRKGDGSLEGAGDPRRGGACTKV
jgi:gamma-glutamyltranspeptidase/glutathione hydrolase